MAFFTMSYLKQDIEFYLPSTSPNQFNPEAMLQSAKMIEDLDVDKIYFSHFGVSYHPGLVISELRKWLPMFVDIAKETLKDQHSRSFEQSSKAVENELKQLVFSVLQKQTISEDDPIYDIVTNDLSICAMGLVDYFHKVQKNRCLER